MLYRLIYHGGPDDGHDNSYSLQPYFSIRNEETGHAYASKMTTDQLRRNEHIEWESDEVRAIHLHYIGVLTKDEMQKLVERMLPNEE